MCQTNPPPTPLPFSLTHASQSLNVLYHCADIQAVLIVRRFC
jgi:hypothetical protein